MPKSQCPRQHFSNFFNGDASPQDKRTEIGPSFVGTFHGMLSQKGSVRNFGFPDLAPFVGAAQFAMTVNCMGDFMSLKFLQSRSHSKQFTFPIQMNGPILVKHSFEESSGLDWCARIFLLDCVCKRNV